MYKNVPMKFLQDLSPLTKSWLYTEAFLMHHQGDHCNSALCSCQFFLKFGICGLSSLHQTCQLSLMTSDPFLVIFSLCQWDLFIPQTVFFSLSVSTSIIFLLITSKTLSCFFLLRCDVQQIAVPMNHFNHSYIVVFITLHVEESTDFSEMILTGQNTNRNETLDW